MYVFAAKLFNPFLSTAFRDNHICVSSLFPGGGLMWGNSGVAQFGYSNEQEHCCSAPGPDNCTDIFKY